MDTELLHQLIVFSECGTLSKAAEQLHTTQPSLSRNMQKLEYAFGVPLFDKQKNHLSLNENGRLAVERAAAVLSDMDQMFFRVQEAEKRKHIIRAGCCAPIPMSMLTGILSMEFPNIKINNEILSEDKLLEGLKQDNYDVVVLAHKLNETNIMQKKLCTEKLFLAVTADSPFSKRRSISFQELDGTVFLLGNSIGVWKDLVVEKMPHSKFLVQNDRESLNTVAELSSIPSFTTDLGGHIRGSRNKSKSIPITDSSAAMTFYTTVNQGNEKYLINR